MDLDSKMRMPKGARAATDADSSQDVGLLDLDVSQLEAF